MQDLSEWIVLTIVIVALVPVLVVMLWVYWWLFRFARRAELKDLEVERCLIEELGANPSAPIPAGRQISVLVLVGGFFLGAWPFILLGKIVFGWVGVGIALVISFFALWYFWERTVGFCRRVELARRSARGFHTNTTVV